MGGKTKSGSNKMSSQGQPSIGSMASFMKGPTDDFFNMMQQPINDSVTSLQSTMTHAGNGPQLPIMANSEIGSQASSSKMQGAHPSLAAMFASANPSSLRPISGQGQKGGK